MGGIREVSNITGKSASIIFSKSLTSKGNNYINTSKNLFEEKVPNWSDCNAAYLFNSRPYIRNISYRFDSISEWGPTYKDTLLNISNPLVNYIDISVDVFPLKNFTNALLVATIQQDSINLYWNGLNFNSFLMIPGKWNIVTNSIKLPDVNLKKTNPVLNVYTWNNQKQNFLIDNFRVRVRRGNPILYWIINKEVILKKR